MRIATALLLAPLLGAQTFVVDQNGGGQFTDLPQAIAAVPSGAVLRVRPGIYSAFTLQNKSLSILGDAPDTVQVDMAAGDVILGPLPSTDRIVLHNVRCLVPPAGGTRLLLQNAVGQLILDHVTMFTPTAIVFGAPPRVQILGSTNVHLLDCAFPTTHLPDGSGLARCDIQGSRVEMARVTMEGEPGGASGFGGFPGNPGLTASNSLLYLHATTVVGGAGAAAVGCGLPSAGPTNGGAGCLLLGGSTLDLVGGTIQGGVGGSGIACRPAGGGGGAGVRVTGSVLRTAGGTIAGGAGGPTGGATGQATVLGPGGAVIPLSAPATLTALRGTPGINQTVQCSLQGSPGDFALLLFGYDQFVWTSPVLAVGALQLSPVLVFGAFVVPGTGVLDVPLAIPPTWPLNQWIPFQYVALPPTLTEVWASNSAGILVKS